MTFIDNLKYIQQTVEQCNSSIEPTIIAVSKRQSDSKVQEALDAGWRIFGENQVQEAIERWSERKKNISNLEIHLIGSLQSNKTKQAVELFDVIHTVDREKIARSLKQEMDKQQRNIPCFIQVNIGEEPQKSGIELERVKDFIDYCVKDIELPIIGLMCIPPFDKTPDTYFNKMKQMQETYGLKSLSMGMSSDYESAVRIGSTHIRIGSFLFGKRDY